MAAPAEKSVKRDPSATGGMAKRKSSSLSTPQCARARELLDQGDIRGARAECKRIVKDAGAPGDAKSEAQDILDSTDIDAGPLAMAVAALITLGFLFMYLAVISGGAGH